MGPIGPRNSSPPRNRLLAALSPADLALLQPHFQSVAMPLLKDLERPNRRIEAVYFLDTGIASVVAVQPDETRTEVGLIGAATNRRMPPTSKSPVKGSESQPRICAML
jgi:hypothetical protein